MFLILFITQNYGNQLSGKPGPQQTSEILTAANLSLSSYNR